ncbi:hypothetical protein [Iningainema tapete]|uniref:Uncharacterized protein n=1 Tax=Iningainema tapete BLCC-T55 TaxID=2748662 RepID=A0A8J7C5D2_9CYAN|nr:hypothetical protein [Iningainema tapete]MBD2770671.1 hypothetical protein [Iningainema tapete BLCC-T55]
MVTSQRSSKSYRKTAADTNQFNVQINWITLTSLLQSPIAYHRIFAEIGGGATAGLFLSQAFYWSQRTSDPDGWFYKSTAEWEAETALTRYEQETVRKRLIKSGLIEEKKLGMPCTLHFRINREELIAAIVQKAQPTLEAETTQNQQFGENHQTSSGKTTKLVRGKPPNLFGENHQTGESQNPFSASDSSAKNSPEITTEITTENTHTSAPNAPLPSQEESVCVENEENKEVVEESSFGTQNQKADRSSKSKIPHVDQSSAPSLNKSLQNQPVPEWFQGTREEYLEFLTYKGSLMVRDKLCTPEEAEAKACAWAKKNPEEAELLWRGWKRKRGQQQFPDIKPEIKHLVIPEFHQMSKQEHAALLQEFLNVGAEEFIAGNYWHKSWLMFAADFPKFIPDITPEISKKIRKVV